MTDQQDYFVPAAGQQDQAEQGLAQEYYDEELRRILKKIAEYDHPSAKELKMLCQALKIDLREIS